MSNKGMTGLVKLPVFNIVLGEHCGRLYSTNFSQRSVNDALGVTMGVMSVVLSAECGLYLARVGSKFPEIISSSICRAFASAALRFTWVFTKPMLR
ncbi:MAG: hypothetical protein U7127_10860 [Phormidium sp.]